jgi:hypothetical protein
MRKFFIFLRNLFKIRTKEPDVRDFKFESSFLKGDTETILLSSDKYWIKLKFIIDAEGKKGSGTIKTNMEKELSELDIIWLLKEYL